MTGFNRFLAKIKTAQWILIALGILAVVVAFVIRVSDNPPGLILLYLGLACLAGAWVWNWPSPRDFWILLLISLAAFPVGVVFHNLLYALGTLVEGSRILSSIVDSIGAFFFLVAVVAAGPTAFIALVGGIYTSWRGMTRLTLINRSYRRFEQKHQIRDKQLYRLLNHVRQSASSANLQPLKYIISTSVDKNEKIFPTLSWAGYLKEWAGPEEGERPSAYIILLGDTELANSFQYDAGIASQSITLGATELGLGACLIGSIKRDLLRTGLSIPDQYQILLVIALGKPAEQVVIDEVGEEGEIKYWRDEKNIHHVPKRGLEEVILEL